MFSIDYNFLFVHIPKTAGNSIQNILKRYSVDKIFCHAPHQDGVERFAVRSELFNTKKHSTLSEYKKEYGDTLFSKLYKFTCVRNPWDRAMSYYFSPGRGQVAWDKYDFIEFVNQIQPIAHYLSIGENEPRPLIHHVAKNVDYIIRFENLETDFERVCEKIGIPKSPLPIRNKSTKDAHYKYYDQETIDIISERFNDEIQYFGYSFTEY